MSSLSKELILLILQFLDEEGMKETLHKLEQESGAFFNMKFFEEKVLAGDWDEVEKYLFGFSKIDDNRYSMKIFFEIRKQKYLEALDKKDTTEAVEVLVKQLKFFQTFNDDLYKEITQLLTLENFRENEQLSKYGDTRTARSMMLMELKKLIEANPLFRDKLAFPTLKQSRLRTLINQSLNWQHQLCKNPRPNPDVKTLFMDHACAPTNGARPVTPLAVPVARPSTYVPLVPHGPFQPTATVANANANGMAGWMANAIASSSGQSAVTTNSAVPLPPNQGVSILKRPRTPPNTMGMVDYHDQEQLLKRMRSGAQALADECRQLPAMDDLPRTVVCTLHQGSDVTSIDFHPSYQTLVLVGLANGDLALWEIGTQKKLLSKPFYVWDMNALSSKFQATFPNGSAISVSHVAWSPDGEFMGVAYTKHLIHLYSCQGPTDLRQLLEIEAHAGGVNDLAFCLPNKQLCVVTCGDDKQMKVWDLSGRNIYNFEGHAAPVYSVCPHHKESIQFIFSTSTDGKIKAWLYDSGGSRVDYDAPGNGCTKLLYSADGTRLFSCGTSVEGATFLVEWNESEGSQKRTYLGLRTKSNGIVQFDTTQNRYLAAGEDHQIKFWNMDNINMLTSTDADGGLPSRPRLKFNKQGNLLLVSTEDNGFKILANAEGLRTLKALEGRSSEMVRTHNEPSGVTAPGPSAIVNASPAINRGEPLEPSSPARPSPLRCGVDPLTRSIEKPRIMEDAPDEGKARELAEIVDPSKCRVVTMPDGGGPASKVGSVIYTNSGGGILALGSDGILKIWKWMRNEHNPSGKATASIVPQHWQPTSGLRMINDVSDVSLEERVPCSALSKNDSYVMSACGGKVTLFNLMTFKVMTQFMLPPPTTNFLVFHPKDNNVLAVGMEDSTIHIYNVRVDEVKTKLKGHQKRITGLTFSTNLKVLVSSGADAQLCSWDTDTWEKRKTVTIQVPSGEIAIGETGVQFHSDQTRLLVFHETQLAIYDASKMECIRQWVPQEVLSAPISYAAYSCNCKLIYAAFSDGNLGVFNAESLTLRCRIAPAAYLSQAVSNSGNVGIPVIAAHPQEPNQFAIGLTDGTVKVLEPLESGGGWWGVGTPAETVGTSDQAATEPRSTQP